jgi:hypothetical protein
MEHIADHDKESSHKGQLKAEMLEKNKQRELQVDKDGNSANHGLMISNL